MKELPEVTLGRPVLRRDGHGSELVQRRGCGCRVFTPRVIEGRRVEDADVSLRDVLVERNGIAKHAAAGMRRTGQETDIRGMAAVDIGVRDAAEDGEIAAVFLRVAASRGEDSV